MFTHDEICIKHTLHFNEKHTLNSDSAVNRKGETGNLTTASQSLALLPNSSSRRERFVKTKLFAFKNLLFSLYQENPKKQARNINTTGLISVCGNRSTTGDIAKEGVASWE